MKSKGFKGFNYYFLFFRVKLSLYDSCCKAL
nr:MAG TPA: hypothetical protein [Caudoviricetes sp.]